MTTGESRQRVDDMRRLAMAACLASGAAPAMARSLVDATVSAACAGRPEVGFAHLVDYLHALRTGGIDGAATPRIDRTLPALIRSDARDGIAQLGFDLAFDDLVDRARAQGVALFVQGNSFTAGELGYYVRRLAGQGLVALAVANSHAMVAVGEGHAPTFGTNPIAFGAPRPAPGAPLVIDQATSATAFVNVARAARNGESIPPGWAIDRHGRATTDAAEAIEGALLPFGGYKGANMALLVEILAAGLTGACWSLDAGSVRRDDARPRTGLTIVAMAATDPAFAQRLEAHLDRLTRMGVHLPGGSHADLADEPAFIDVDATTLAAIRGFIA